MHLMIKTVDDHTVNVEIQEGNSAEQELSLLLSREGRYESGWVPLGKPETPQTFLRYERIASVRIVPT